MKVLVHVGWEHSSSFHPRSWRRAQWPETIAGSKQGPYGRCRRTRPLKQMLQMSLADSQTFWGGGRQRGEQKRAGERENLLPWLRRTCTGLMGSAPFAVTPCVFSRCPNFKTPQREEGTKVSCPLLCF